MLPVAGGKASWEINSPFKGQNKPEAELKFKYISSPQQKVIHFNREQFKLFCVFEFRGHKSSSISSTPFAMSDQINIHTVRDEFIDWEENNISSYIVFNNIFYSWSW